MQLEEVEGERRHAVAEDVVDGTGGNQLSLLVECITYIYLAHADVFYFIYATVSHDPRYSKRPSWSR